MTRPNQGLSSLALGGGGVGDGERETLGTRLAGGKGWVGRYVGKREQEKCRKSEGGEPTQIF